MRERTTFTAKSIENKLIDADGNPAKLKKGTEVDVTIEADNKDTSSEE